MFPITYGRYPVFKFINANINLMAKYIPETEGKDFKEMEEKFSQLR